MYFYKVDFKQSLPKNAMFPCVLLTGDSWNDFGYSTFFESYYYQHPDNRIYLGSVKILNLENNSTQRTIPTFFTQLNENFCSLWQKLEHYKTISSLSRREYTAILEGLNDVATQEALAKKFFETEGFQNSLIRWSEAEKAYYEGKKYFKRRISKNFSFDFSTHLPKATRSHDIKFDFNRNIYVPYRINAIVGKNGTGKTEILARLANALSGSNNEKYGGRFKGKRPSFSKVIGISYSYFDEFERPDENDNTFSYKYCGIRNTEGILSLKQLREKFEDSYHKICYLGRREKWKEILSEIIEPEHKLILEILEQRSSEVDLSSGQNLIIAVMTDVLANIEKESVLLFDEPELHLHPNAISNLIRMLTRLLKEFKSFAIISTHSPLILQEIPSRYITVVERIENTPLIRQLEGETFGENITTIVNEVFGVTNEESNYKVVLRKLSERMTYEQILDLFEGKLSFNAMVYLKSLE